MPFVRRFVLPTSPTSWLWSAPRLRGRLEGSTRYSSGFVGQAVLVVVLVLEIGAVECWRIEIRFVLVRYSSPPTSRSARVEDEDDDEYEKEMPGDARIFDLTRARFHGERHRVSRPLFAGGAGQTRGREQGWYRELGAGSQ